MNTNKYIPISDKFRKNDANNIVLFTNARDEPKLAEWVAHHLLLGFDRIIIFDHLSQIPIKEQLHQYASLFSSKVTIIPVNGGGNVKNVLGNRAIHMARRINASWMLYLDADEFLCINMKSKTDNSLLSVKQLLNQWHFADAISINWLMYGTNGHKTQPDGFLMDNFTKSEMLLDKHVKTFVRPFATKQVIDPHTYKLYNPNRYFSIDGKPKAETPFYPVKYVFTKAPAYIAHYCIQSEEEFKRRKGRQMDDGNPAYASTVDSSFFDIGNTVVNNQVQYKYSNRIKEFLKQK